MLEARAHLVRAGLHKHGHPDEPRLAHQGVGALHVLREEGSGGGVDLLGWVGGDYAFENVGGKNAGCALVVFVLIAGNASDKIGFGTNPENDAQCGLEETVLLKCFWFTV